MRGLAVSLVSLLVALAPRPSGLSAQQSAASCHAKLGLAVAAPCSLLDTFLAGDTSAQYWPDGSIPYDVVSKPDELVTSNDALVVAAYHICPAIDAQGAVSISVFFGDLGEVSIEQEHGDWLFRPGVRWEQFSFRLVHRSDRWTIDLGRNYASHLSASATTAHYQGPAIEAWRRQLAAASRQLDRVPLPRCPAA
jgi:hypothetical protein